MNKKITIIICAILLLAGCFMIIYNQNHFNVRGTAFTIPQGYHTSESGSAVEVTDGADSVIVGKEVEDNNLNQSIEKYIKAKAKENTTVEITDFYVNGIKVYKGTVLNTSIVYYWFMKNDNLYWMYSWSSSDKTDSIACDLIKSTDSII